MVAIIGSEELLSPSMTAPSLVNQTAPTSVLDVLHHQHEEGGSGHSGTVFVTHVGIWI